MSMSSMARLPRPGCRSDVDGEEPRLIVRRRGGVVNVRPRDCEREADETETTPEIPRLTPVSASNWSRRRATWHWTSPPWAAHPPPQQAYRLRHQGRPERLPDQDPNAGQREPDPARRPLPRRRRGTL